MFALSRLTSWVLLVVIGIVLLVGCVPHQKIVYLQPPSSKQENGNTYPYKITPYRVHSNDNLFIKIFSLDESTSIITDTKPENELQPIYKVNESGEVNLPIIGRVMVANLTMEEVQAHLLEQYQSYFNNISVFVKLSNFQVTVLGEVKSPGLVSIQKEKITIYELLSMVGDLNDFSNRHEVKIIRQIDDTYVVKYVNLLDENILGKEDMFILPNDIVYVKPLKVKSWAALSVPINTILSIASASIVIISFLNLK